MIKTFLVEVKDSWSPLPPRRFRAGIDEDKASERGARSDARYITRAANAFWDRERYRISVAISAEAGVTDMQHEQVVEL